MRKGFYNNKGLPGYKVGWGGARNSFLIEFSSPAGREREQGRVGARCFCLACQKSERVWLVGCLLYIITS